MYACGDLFFSRVRADTKSKIRLIAHTYKWTPDVIFSLDNYWLDFWYDAAKSAREDKF